MEVVSENEAEKQRKSDRMGWKVRVKVVVPNGGKELNLRAESYSSNRTAEDHQPGG